MQHCITLCNTIATLCNTLLHPASLCNTLQHCSTLFNTLQHCETLFQHFATLCNTLQHSETLFQHSTTLNQHCALAALCSCSFDLLHDRRFTFPSAAMQLDLDLFQNSSSHQITRVVDSNDIIAVKINCLLTTLFEILTFGIDLTTNEDVV